MLLYVECGWPLRLICALGMLLGFAAVQSYADDPIAGEDYQRVAGRGLATSWYKTDSNNYTVEQIRDFKARGFENVRLRTNTNYYSSDSELDQLAQTVDDCIAEGLVPIISWINHEVEGADNPTTAQRDDFAAWWGSVAAKMQGKSHTLAFSLFTEIGGNAFRERPAIYNDWTQHAVDAIRAISPTRMIILSAPGKKVESLEDIDEAIFSDDDYMMAEWHLYASGPNQNGGQKNWVGDGSASDRAKVTDPIDDALDFQSRKGLYTYFGAWMPMDNGSGSLTQEEVEAFAVYMIERLEESGIPWRSLASPGRPTRWGNIMISAVKNGAKQDRTTSLMMTVIR